jgi:hypothetical protein
MQLREYCHDVREHKLLALRAIIIGVISILVLWRVVALPLANLDDWLYVTGIADIRHFWRGGRSFFAHFLIGGGINFSVGWMVRRLHRRYRVAMVSCFFVTLLVFADLPRVVPAALTASRDANVFWRFIGIALLDFAFLRLPILVGGIWAVSEGPVASLWPLRSPQRQLQR